MKKLFFMIKQGLFIFSSVKYWNFFTIFVFSMILIFATLLFDGVNILNNFVYQIEKDIEVELFLNDTVSMNYANVIKNKLSLEKEVDSTYIISRKEAKDYFLSQFPDISLPGNENPLPISIVVRLKDSYFVSNNLNVLIKRLKSIKGVTSVDYNQKIFKKIIDFKRYFNIGVPIVYGILILLGGFLIYNSIKNSLEYKRQYANVISFIGGGRTFLLVPFLVEVTISAMFIIFFTLISIEFLNRWILMFFYLSKDVLWIERGFVVLITIFLSYFFTFFTLRSYK